MKKTLPIYLCQLTIVLAMALLTHTAGNACETPENGCEESEDCGDCCTCFNGYCIPDPSKELPPNTPSTGEECCGGEPVPEGWMCCNGVIFSEDPYPVKFSFNAPEVDIPKLPVNMGGGVGLEIELKNRCCNGEIIKVTESSYSGDIKLGASGDIPLGPGSLSLSIEGSVSVSDKLIITCEDRNPCFDVELALTGSADWGPGWKGLVRIAAGAEVESKIPFEICALPDEPYYTINPKNWEGCTRIYAELENPRGDLRFFEVGILGSCSIFNSSDDDPHPTPTPYPMPRPDPKPTPTPLPPTPTPPDTSPTPMPTVNVFPDKPYPENPDWLK